MTARHESRACGQKRVFRYSGLRCWSADSFLYVAYSDLMCFSKLGV